MKTLKYLEKWTRPSSYIGATWEGYYIFLGQNRDSDALTRSNFRVGLAALEKLAAFVPPVPEDEGDEGDEEESRVVVRESHWAVGWVEWIAIHESDTLALEAADAMQAGLDNYPVLNEEDFSSLEQEEADATWKNCYDEKERIAYVRKWRDQFSFHSLADMIGCIRGKYFAGYASELLH